MDKTRLTSATFDASVGTMDALSLRTAQSAPARVSVRAKRHAIFATFIAAFFALCLAPTAARAQLVPNVPEGFENGYDGWSADNGVWTVGTPTVGPDAAYAGTYCAGTAMSGNARANMSSRLISPAFTVPVASQNPRLQFWQWFKFGGSNNGTGSSVDVGNVLILPAGSSTWVTLLTVSGTSGPWTEPELNLSAYAGTSVQIAFQFISGDEVYSSAPGWYVDNVTLVTGAINTIAANVPEGFESAQGLQGDWSVDNGVWTVGTPTVGPEAAYAGTYCAGTAMSGNAPISMSSRLISPAFTVPATSQNPRLQFWQWFKFGGSNNGTGSSVDLGNVLIRPAGSLTWVTLLTVSGTSGPWTEPELNLSAYAGTSVQIAFQFISGDEVYSSAPGWYVDNVTLVTGAINTIAANAPEGFESAQGLQGDWSADNGVWTVGTPTAGPDATYAGTYCAGTAMSGNAPANMSSRLISPAFTVPAASQNPRLQFWQWFQFGGSNNGTGSSVDVGKVLILPAGSSAWVTLLTVSGTGGPWTEPELNLSAYAGTSVQIAFQFISGDEVYSSAPGWYVDNVTLVTGAINTIVANVPEGFESTQGLQGDWSADNGVWTVGPPTVGPGAAYAGTYCAGTAMSGNAPANMSSRLISPAFTVPAANQNPKLQFWQWFKFGSSNNGTGSSVDVGKVLILPPGSSTWVTLATISGTSESWTEDTLALSTYAGQLVQIAFQFISGDEVYSSAPGWYVDNVTILSTAPAPAVTSAPTNVLSGWAMLNGIANPNSVATTAYFEYGTTTAYGSQTASLNVGSGTSAASVGFNLAGLAPGTTYYYQLVVQNSNGTFYGGQQTFITPGTTSPPQWHSNLLTSTANMASGSRTGVANPSLDQYYYKGTDSNVWCVYFNGSEWTQKALTSNSNVSDWLTFQPNYGYVYYLGTDNQIWCLYFNDNGAQWEQAQQTANGNIASDIVVDTVWNFFYYRGNDNNIWADYFNGTAWTQKALTTLANAAGSLSVDSTLHFIYYRSADNNMWVCYFNGTSWITQKLSTTANVGGAVTADANNVVYYSSSADNTAWAEYFNGTAWTQKQLVAGSSLAGATALYAQYVTIYVNGSGQAETLYLSGSNWSSVVLGDGGSELTEGLSVNTANNWIFCGGSYGNVMIFYYQ